MRVIKKNGIDVIMYRYGCGDTAEIFDIAVMSERGKGIGRSLVEEAILDLQKNGCKKLYAFTRDSNHKAREFYRHLGFTEHIIKDFYPDGNAVLEVKSI